MQTAILDGYLVSTLLEILDRDLEIYACSGTVVEPFQPFLRFYLSRKMKR